jgi:hypothetical protein
MRIKDKRKKSSKQKREGKNHIGLIEIVGTASAKSRDNNNKKRETTCIFIL